MSSIAWQLGPCCGFGFTWLGLGCLGVAWGKRGRRGLECLFGISLKHCQTGFGMV